MAKIKTLFLSVFAWVVNCYDNSVFEKIMSKIFGFFTKNAPDSRCIDFFKNRFSNGSIWNNSIAARIVRFPFAFCRRYYHKHEEKIEKIKSTSAIYKFFNNAEKISLRDYGSLFIALGIGTAIGTLIFMKWTSVINIAVSAVFLMIGLFLSLSKETFASLASDSSILNGFFKTVSYYRQDILSAEKAVSLSGLKIFQVVAVILGAIVFAFEPLGATVCIVGIIGIFMILWKTEIGVFLFVPFSAILPTMVLAGLVLLTFASFVLHLLFGKNTEYTSTPFQPWIALFMALSCYAAVTSLAVVSSIKILMLYITFTLAYVLIVNTIKSRAQWAALVTVLIGAAVVIALYGIYQNFFLDATTQSWVDEEMFTDIKKRVFSTLDNPNVLGEYFIMFIPVAFVMILKMQGTLRKAFYTLCNIVMFACLMYTWSRGAWLGVIIGILFFVLLKDRRWIVLCVAGLLIMPSVLPASIMDRLTSIGNLKDSSTAYRVAVWIGSLRLIQDYWFCGVGIGPDAFLEVYPQYALGGAGFALHSHNFYLQWIVDMGIMGIIAYLGIIATAFKQIVNVPERHSLIKNVLLAMSGALFGYLFHGMAENLWYNYRMILVFWVFIGILQSGAMIVKSETEGKVTE